MTKNDALLPYEYLIPELRSGSFRRERDATSSDLDFFFVRPGLLADEKDKPETALNECSAAQAWAK